MKGLKFIAVLLAVLLIAGGALAFTVNEFTKYSGAKTADAAISTAPGYFYGIIVSTDASNAATFKIYDHATASTGSLIIPIWNVTTSATDKTQSLLFRVPVEYENGIYVDLTCAGLASYEVYYQER